MSIQLQDRVIGKGSFFFPPLFVAAKEVEAVFSEIVSKTNLMWKISWNYNIMIWIFEKTTLKNGFEIFYFIIILWGLCHYFDVILK